MIKNKNLVFLELNSSYSHSMLSYCLIRSLAEREAPGWNWMHTAATIKTPVDEIIRDVEACKPDILLATAYIFNVELLCEICSLLKEHNENLCIYLGGPCFLGNNEEFLRANPAVSGVIRGDESSVPDLLQGRGEESIAGLCRIDKDGIYQDNSFADYNRELDALPSPYQEGRIHSGKAFYQLETSRGCGGACSFCTSSKSHGVKYHSLERVRKDLQALYKAGYREIRLIDRTFNEDKQRAVDMLKMFAEDFSDMRFHLEIHPGRLKPEVLAQLAKAEPGSLHLEAGIQSFDPVVLRSIRRPANSDKAKAGLKELLKLNNLEIHSDLIAGLPGQTLTSLIADINTMLELEPDEIQLENLKILPGTELADNPPSELEYQSRPPWAVISTKEMSPIDLKKASLYSYIIDSWYNPTQIRNVFRFCVRYIDNFWSEFVNYVEPCCDLNKGKMSLEKRFTLLEKFLYEKDRKAWELCCFAKIACGFACDHVKLQKYTVLESHKEELIWLRDGLSESVKIKRCIIFESSFNTADFWLDPNSDFKELTGYYVFKLHYGRNVASVVKI